VANITLSVHNMMDGWTVAATVISNYTAGILIPRFSAVIVKARHLAPT